MIKLKEEKRKSEEVISLKAELRAVTGERDRLTTLFERLGKQGNQNNNPKSDKEHDELNLDG